MADTMEFKGTARIFGFAYPDEGMKGTRRVIEPADLVSAWDEGMRKYWLTLEYTDGHGVRETRSVSNVWTQDGAVYVARKGVEYWQLVEHSSC